MTLWTDADILKSKAILKKYPLDRYQDALKAIGKALKRTVTTDSLRNAFVRNKEAPPSSFCADYAEEEATEEDASPSELSELAKRLVSCAKKPVSLEALCDKMGLSPSKVKDLISEVRAAGVRLHIEHNHIGIAATVPSEVIQGIGIAPVVGKRQQVAVISDTHLGSKYCLRAELRDFIEHAYAQGIREILHPGDVLDGMYRHGIFELSHTGLDEQTQDLFETLPQLPGLNYRCITGNHDGTFMDTIGISVGAHIENYFRARGRNDIHFYGDRGAYLKIGGAVIHLWHPRSGTSHARSYGIQKQIEKYSSGNKPALLLIGHWHIHCSVFERGIHGIACPTFQGGGSSFGKSLGGAPAIGGLILSWGLTEHGTMRDFNLSYRAYFEKEKLVHLDGFEDSRP